MGERYHRKEGRAQGRRSLQGSSSPGEMKEKLPCLQRVGAVVLLGSAVPQLRLLEPDGAQDAGTQMERIRHVRHTSLRIHSVPLRPPRQNEESQGDSGRWPDPWDLWRAIRWLEGITIDT